MANTLPPPGENSKAMDLRRRLQAPRSKVPMSTEEIADYRDDTGNEVANVVPLKRRAKPLELEAKTTFAEPQVPSTVPSIARGKRVEDKRVAVGVDEAVFAEIREASQLEKIAGYVEFKDKPVSAEDTARALLALRDEDYVGAYSDKKNTFNDDDDLFIPVAQVALLMFSKTKYQYSLDDQRIVSLVSVVRDPDTMFQRLVGILKTWATVSIRGKRVPAVIKGR